MRFGVGITLFRPKEESVAYITALHTLFDCVYVYDNSSDNSAYKAQLGTCCRYYFNGRNDGLSIAFNCCLDAAADDGIDYLLLLDQDSMYDIDVLRRLMAEIQTEAPNASVAIRACKAQPTDHEHLTLPETHTNEERKVISSGSFISMAAVRDHRLRYEENLFVDYVDDEFCMQIRSKGLKILCHNRYILPQQLGYRYRGRICHSPVRHYYMVRDLGYFNKKYYSRVKTELKSFLFLIKDILNALQEDRTAEKIVCALKGYGDYLYGKHGEY